MKHICPHCNKVFDEEISREEQEEVQRLLLKDKKFMKYLGEQAANSYLGIGKEGKDE